MAAMADPYVYALAAHERLTASAADRGSPAVAFRPGDRVAAVGVSAGTPQLREASPRGRPLLPPIGRSCCCLPGPVTGVAAVSVSVGTSAQLREASPRDARIRRRQVERC
jgi:hypothetical protein